jgi:hypothetical protein
VCLASSFARMLAHHFHLHLNIWLQVLLCLCLTVIIACSMKPLNPAQHYSTATARNCHVRNHSPHFGRLRTGRKPFLNRASVAELV